MKAHYIAIVSAFLIPCPAVIFGAENTNSQISAPPQITIPAAPDQLADIVTVPNYPWGRFRAQTSPLP